MSNKIDYYRLAPGSSIEFSDIESLKAVKETTGHLGNRRLSVEKTTSMADGIVEYKFVYFAEDANKDNYLLVVETFEESGRYFLFKQASLAPANRKGNIDFGNSWLFQEPANPEQFSYLSLKYTLEFPENKNNGEVVTYFQKSMGERSGRYYECSQNSLSNQLMTISFYAATEQPGFYVPQAAILEIGRNGLEEGGVISLYTGQEIRESEIEVFAK